MPYYRVSSDRQGQSGLGLEAQEKAVNAFAKSNSYKLIAKVTEIESGKRNKRPILQQAIDYCLTHKATLLIAKLDRLGRNVAFISALMESKVDFIAVDNPYANKLIVHIMAAFAEYERDQISTRTKEALQVAKKRGVKLGEFGKKVLSKHNRESSIAFAKKIKPVIKKLQREGFESVREITAQLNERNVPTYSQKGVWHISTVHRILKRIEKL